MTTSPESYQAFNTWAQDPYFKPPDPPFDSSYPAQDQPSTSPSPPDGGKPAPRKG